MEGCMVCEMSEKISLQPENSEEVELEDHDRHSKHSQLLEQDVATDFKPGTSHSAKGTVTKSRWKKIFTTVATFLAALFLNAGISMIAPFYPIVVSFINKLVQ